MAVAGATAFPDAANTVFGAATEEFAPSNLEVAGGLTLNLAGAANCAAVRTETVQHDSNAQFDAVTAEFDAVLRDELLECIAQPPDIPRIE